MRIKAKLRRIGNSMGVILPSNVITGYAAGDIIEVNVITKRWPDKTHEMIDGLYEEPADVPSVQTVPASSRQAKLAPDGYPIQHTNSMMVGYVPK